MPELLALELGDESFTLRPPTTTLRTDVLLKLRFRITGHLFYFTTYILFF